MIKVETDTHSGFCGGVIRAIDTAEGYLKENGTPLYSLGAIVHNEAELSRLGKLGLVSVSRDDLKDLSSIDRSFPVLIRAHGEPPEVYDTLSSLGLKIIDCTCPVVLKLQKAIREAYLRLKSRGGRVVIYGKEGHPEVLGLVGQVGGDVLVVQNLSMLEDAVSVGALAVNRDIELFSQTTMSPSGYEELSSFLKGKMILPATLTVHNTICSQVAARHKQLSEFAKSKDVIVFVAGKESSNGKVLCEMCRKENYRTYLIGSEEELRREWFLPSDRVGVCGATSTPAWLLERVSSVIENLQ